MARIVLASSSPRRRELLTRAGIRFTVVEPPEDGRMPPGMCADLVAQLTARQKAVAVASSQPPGSFVLGADTIVVGPTGPLGKPGTPERARSMLEELRGRRHTVLTGICVIVAQSDREALGLGRSAVTMHHYTDEAIHTYVNSGEPLDRAGSYAIQGGGGDLIEAVTGRIDTVVGLDVPLALRLLAQAGYPDPLPAATDVPLAPPRAARRPLAPLRAATRV
ncbi:MAG: septum formation protein Maf [Candidatus Dormibacteraeota bacterium]|uniref:dTTP/UTP pyrophosphatase n=1 Tax=Candidatus Amunia macphersoniae TaxID=3127014 RepID=A0A934KN65_9BACT|nr:septum formation protein Maf [Candidatus Dormibacteraeota bacterium]